MHTCSEFVEQVIFIVYQNHDDFNDPNILSIQMDNSCRTQNCRQGISDHTTEGSNPPADFKSPIAYINDYLSSMILVTSSWVSISQCLFLWLF